MIRPPTAQDRAEAVLAQIETALRIARSGGASAELIAELKAIHLRLHQRGLRHDAQASFF